MLTSIDLTQCRSTVAEPAEVAEVQPSLRSNRHARGFDKTQPPCCRLPVTEPVEVAEVRLQKKSI